MTLERLRPWLLALLVIAGAGTFFRQRAAENDAADKVREAVASASHARVNGQDIQDPALLFATLRLLDHVGAHHSGPVGSIRVDLLNGEKVSTIVIARDSQRPTEFWVFLPGNGAIGGASGQEAGRITSRDLDSFLRSRGL